MFYQVNFHKSLTFGIFRVKYYVLNPKNEEKMMIFQFLDLWYAFLNS